MNYISFMMYNLCTLSISHKQGPKLKYHIKTYQYKSSKEAV